MKITNKLGLPQALVNAVKNDPYDPGKCDLTVSRLVSPPRIVALERLHHEEIEEDVSDRIWSLFGQAVHTVLERSETQAATEVRLSIQRQNWTISGCFDNFSMADGVLQDYKVTTVYSATNGARAEWIAQLNLYATILREHCQNVRKLEVIAIMRDWSKMAQQRNNSYPPAGAMKIEIPLWTEEQCEGYLDERIRLHQMAQKHLPDCLPDERWAKPDTWAVLKEGNKRAVKIYDVEVDARKVAEMSGPGYSVEHRPGENLRCIHFCSMARWCLSKQVG